MTSFRSRFTEAERAYLATQLLGRLATVSPEGIVQNSPVGFRLRTDDTIDIGGFRMGQTKKFRNVANGSARVAFVIDDLASIEPWTPRYVEVRGVAEALSDAEPPQEFMTRQVLKIRPEQIFSYGV